MRSFLTFALLLCATGCTAYDGPIVRDVRYRADGRGIILEKCHVHVLRFGWDYVTVDDCETSSVYAPPSSR